MPQGGWAGNRGSHPSLVYKDAIPVVPVLSVVFRARIAILAVLLVGFAGVLFLAFYRQPTPVGALFLSAVSLVIATLSGFFHLRHALLAAVVALAPLPGMFAAGLFAVPAGLTFSGLLAVYGFSYAAGSLLGADILRGVLEGRDRVEAAQDGLARAAMPLAIAVAVGAALIGGWLFRSADMPALAAAVELIAASVSVLLFVPFAASVLPYGEMLIAEANRTRERRESVVRWLTAVVEPRWAMSLTGIAVVFATLAGFGAEGLLTRTALLAQPALWGASVLLLFLVTFAVTRDWREALGITVALSLLALTAIWLWGEAVGRVTGTTFIGLSVVVDVALFWSVAMAVRARRYRLEGDAVGVARLRSIEDCGMALMFGAGGTMASVLPWLLLHGSIGTLALLFVPAGAAALAGGPAIATALETMIRRRVSVEELYGRGRS